MSLHPTTSPRARQMRPSLRAGGDPLDQNRQGASKTREPTWAHSARRVGLLDLGSPRPGVPPELDLQSRQHGRLTTTLTLGVQAPQSSGRAGPQREHENPCLGEHSRRCDPPHPRPAPGNASIAEHHTGSGCSPIRRPLLGPHSSLTHSLGWPPAPKSPVTRDPEMKQPQDAGAGSSSSI